MNWGHRIFSWCFGERVGIDRFGNRYYRSRRWGRHHRERRWVIYRGEEEASKIPPEWHAWLHFTADKPLTEAMSDRRPWQKEHVPNLTGTPDAYRPRGHVLRGGRRASATGDYEPWRPS